MKGRALPLAVALVMAAVAVMSVYLYVNRVEDETMQGLQKREVLVATRFLGTGSQGISILEEGGVELREVPMKYVSPGAMDSPQDIAGLTLVDDVAAGEQLTAERFASPEQNVFVADLPKGTEALSVPFEFVRAVSGHLQAGDRINIYVTGDGKEGNRKALRKLEKMGVPTSAPIFDPEEGVTFLLQKSILVVEVPVAAAEGAVSTVTLAVSPEEAAELIQAQEFYKLWFTLAESDTDAASLGEKVDES